MAIGNPALCANAGETTSDNQTVITTTANIPSGQYIIGVVVSNGNATDGNTNIHTALTVGTQALTKVREQQEGGSSDATSVVTSLWVGTNYTGSQINSGANVTADFDAARADKRITIISGTIGAGMKLELADGTSLDFDNYISSGGSDMRVQNVSGMTSESHLCVAAWGCDATATTFTASTNFTRVVTTGQVTGTNGTRVEWRVNTSTAEASDPASNCGNSTEWTAVFAAFREVSASLSVSPTGLASAQAFGSLTIVPGGTTVAMTGLGSAQSFGTLKLNQAFSVTGLGSAQQFGLISLKFVVFGIPSAQAFGVPTNKIAFFVAGLNSAQAFGVPDVSTDGGGQNVSASGLASAQAFGSPTMSPGGVVVVLTGLNSAQAFGAIEADQAFVVSGLNTAQAFGSPTFAFGGTTRIMVGLNTAQAFGSPSVTTPGGAGGPDPALFQRQRRRRR
jgi:hypothetical protein